MMRMQQNKLEGEWGLNEFRIKREKKQETEREEWQLTEEEVHKEEGDKVKRVELEPLDVYKALNEIV